MWVETLLLVGVVLLLSWDFLFGSRPKNFPPGPIRFPIVGNLPLLGSQPLETIAKWKDTYGDIIGLRLGSFNVVVLNGHDIIKEAYDKPEFSGRPALGPILLIAGKEKRGLVASEGQHWSEQRRFALRNLRDFGFGKKSMEGTIQENASDLIAVLKKNKGAPVNTHRMLSLVVLSSLWTIIAGEQLPIDDPKAQELLDTLSAVISSTTISGPVFFMPWLAKLAPKITGWSGFESAIIRIKSFMGEKIQHHIDTRDPNNPRDFMDVYLNEMDKTTDQNSSFYGKAGSEHMLVGNINLFGAGSETTSTTLNWAFYLLAKDQEVQRKMQKELDSIVGKNRLPSLDDKDILVYTDAVTQEIFRKSTIIPFGVLHSVMEPVTFHGFEIPKDTAVISNLYDVHHNPKTWGDPENFRPERFLSPDGKTLIKPGPIIPFLVGKRACLGETLARANFYLILTAVVQRFNISFDPNTPVSEKISPSLIRSPPKCKLIFKDRMEG